MRDITRSIYELTVKRILDPMGRDITPGANPHGGMDYFVDGNASASGEGTSWGKGGFSPYKTLAEAIAASNTSIALSANRWWARRNRIFCCGDALDETLTQLPTKCDIIGVGSYDGYTRCGLSGNHSSAAECYGTRFFNMHFLADATASAIFTLAGANSASGVQFHDCCFDGTLGTVTSGILATAMPFLGVFDCEFKGAFATSYISFGAGEAGGARIENNVMSGSAAAGIIVNASTTTSWEAWLRNNSIEAATLVFDDNSDLFHYVGNDFISDVAVTAGYAEAVDANPKLGARNYLTADNIANVLYPVVDTTT